MSRTLRPHGRLRAITMVAATLFITLIGLGVIMVTTAGTPTTVEVQSTGAVQSRQEAGCPTIAAPGSSVFYVDPNVQAAQFVADNPCVEPLATIPQGKWFGGWTTPATIQKQMSAYTSAARAAGKIPLPVLYMIPGRDCGSYSAGGVSSADEYRTWIDGAAAGMAGNRAIVILEPDALPQLNKSGCSGQEERAELLAYAVTQLKAVGADVYIDAGHSNWHSPVTMAERLRDVNVAEADGYSTNVSNYQTTANEIAYANAVNTELGKLGITGKRYVIDTSRNGAGPESGSDYWCNPVSARLGETPKVIGGDLHAYLWIKNPGESDGSCNGGPNNGFWVTGAHQLLGYTG